MIDRLYLVRHGEAKSKQEDPDRPLNDQGRQNVERMATWAADSGLPVDQIRHSGKRRAEQTAGIFVRRLQPPAGAIAIEGIDPNDDVRPLAQSLDQDSGHLMLVGHLPFLSRLVGQLLFGDPDRTDVGFDAAALVILERQHNTWALNCVMQPSLIE